MARRDVVVVGASAGGVAALQALVAGLPADFGAAVVIVLHRPAGGEDVLPQILARAGPLPVSQARDGDPLSPGSVLVAPPGRHIVVEDEHVTLSRGPRENGHRPSVDVLFRSSALALGPRVVGVVLSGALDDGTAGMVAVKLRGGVGVAQHPDDAQVGEMPRAAIRAAAVDHVAAATEIPALLAGLVGGEAPVVPNPTSAPMTAETTMVDDNRDGPLQNYEGVGHPADLTCPDCHGPLREVVEGGLARYRCRVGHAWSPHSLAAQQAISVENALWMAMVTLEEKASLRETLSRQASAEGRHLTAQGFRRAAEKARRAAAQIRVLVEGTSSEPESPPLQVEDTGGPRADLT